MKIDWASVFCLDGERVIRISTGEEAKGTLHKQSGYLVVTCKGRTIKYHRLKFYLKHGWLPRLVDHEDRNKGNNLLDNLRPATKSQNGMNSTRMKASGLPRGVFKNGSKGWRAEVTANGVTHNLGTYSSVEEADRVATEGRCKYHGDFSA